MVVKHRSPSDSYIQTLNDEKYSLPYGDTQLNRSSSSGTNISLQATDTSMRDKHSTIPRFIRNNSRRAVSVLPSLTKISFFVAACYGIRTLLTEVRIREKELQSVRREFTFVEDALLQNEAKVDGAHTALFDLQTQFTKLLPGDHKHTVAKGEEFNGGALYEKIVNRQTAMKDRVNELQDTIADLNYMEAIEHFGSEAYKVQFNLKIESKIFSFVVEMAPLELMPHSVNYFMEMVKANVWDNSIFTHSSNHILLAELKDSEGNDKRDLFRAQGINQLSFPEYSDDYPHDKYTLGFGGRPGGPGFYINTQDNTAIHGPGGQSTYELHEEADPCFGKVIEGHGVVDWLQERSEQALIDANKGTTFTVIDSIRVIT